MNRSKQYYFEVLILLSLLLLFYVVVIVLILAPSDTLHSVAVKLSTGKDIVAIMDFAGSAALQAVSECPRRC